MLFFSIPNTKKRKKRYIKGKQKDKGVKNQGPRILTLLFNEAKKITARSAI